MKILDNDFRNSLYKNLLDIGYEKQEAQKIIAIKYFDALKQDVQEFLNSIQKSLDVNVFQPLSEADVNRINNDMSELTKMYEVLSKTEQ
jgi:hypothetical protein